MLCFSCSSDGRPCELSPGCPSGQMRPLLAIPVNVRFTAAAEVSWTLSFKVCSARREGTLADQGQSIFSQYTFGTAIGIGLLSLTPHAFLLPQPSLQFDEDEASTTTQES